MFGVNKDGTLVTAACHLCGRVLHDEEDELPEKGTDGKVAWCTPLHSPDGLAEIVEINEWFEAVRAEAEEIRRQAFLRVVDEAVYNALHERGLA